MAERPQKTSTPFDKPHLLSQLICSVCSSTLIYFQKCSSRHTFLLLHCEPVNHRTRSPWILHICSFLASAVQGWWYNSIFGTNASLHCFHFPFIATAIVVLLQLSSCLIQLDLLHTYTFKPQSQAVVPLIPGPWRQWTSGFLQYALCYQQPVVA